MSEPKGSPCPCAPSGSVGAGLIGKGNACLRTDGIGPYRRAAEGTLDQLARCVDYLPGIRKNGTAWVIQRDVAQVRWQIKESV